MLIELWEKKIERFHTPSNSETNDTIKSISKGFITEYCSNDVPRVGDVIAVRQRMRAYVEWEVLKVIRIIDDKEEKIILEVRQYSEKSYYSSGSNSWFENIPLVIHIEED
jgi:hypothetical protein